MNQTCREEYLSLQVLVIFRNVLIIIIMMTTMIIIMMMMMMMMMIIIIITLFVGWLLNVPATS